jgi:formate dehydrogenase major subunit
VNSSRWVQWKQAALDPPGMAMRDQEIIAALFLNLRALYQKEGGSSPEPLLKMSWNYANPTSPSLEEVAKEINGRETATGHQLSSIGELKDDGSTLCGNWLYSGSFTEGGNMMARRGQEDPTGLGFFPGWSWNGPPTYRKIQLASADSEGVLGLKQIDPWMGKVVGV